MKNLSKIDFLCVIITILDFFVLCFTSVIDLKVYMIVLSISLICLIFLVCRFFIELLKIEKRRKLKNMNCAILSIFFNIIHGFLLSIIYTFLLFCFIKFFKYFGLFEKGLIIFPIYLISFLILLFIFWKINVLLNRFFEELDKKYIIVNEDKENSK